MELLPAFRTNLEHHYWARDRQLEACAALTGEQFLRPVGGSYASLRDTFGHMVAVEWIWLERWLGRSPSSLISAEEFPSLAALSGRWSAVERELRAYLAGLDEEALIQPVSYNNLRGQPWSYPLWQMITHLQTHQSYHRGQVTTLLRILGVQPPPVDFLIAQDAGWK
jgi:uncharacterized damage-inducible protein DinB